MLPDNVLDHVSDAVLSLDGDWRVSYLNRPAELLLRKRSQDMIGRTIWELLPDLVGSPTERTLRTAAEDGVPARWEHFLPSLYAWHAVHSIPLDGGGMMLFLRDITDRARMLRDDAVRARIREILEHAPVAVTVLRGAEHRIEMQNQLARRLTGERDVEGMAVRNAYPELEGQGFFELLDGVFATGEPFEGFEVPARFDRTGGGEMVEGCFNIVYQPVFDEQARVAGILSLAVEVTDLVQRRQQADRIAAERGAILDEIAEGVIVGDEAGRVTLVNAVAARMLGVDPDADPLPDLTGRLHREDGTPLTGDDLPLARAAFAGDAVRDARWRLRRPDGSELHVRGNTAAVTDAEGRRIAAVLTLRELPGDAPTAGTGPAD